MVEITDVYGRDEAHEVIRRSQEDYRAAFPSEQAERLVAGARPARRAGASGWRARYSTGSMSSSSISTNTPSRTMPSTRA